MVKDTGAGAVVFENPELANHYQSSRMNDSAKVSTI